MPSDHITIKLQKSTAGIKMEASLNGTPFYTRTTQRHDEHNPYKAVLEKVAELLDFDLDIIEFKAPVTQR